MDVFVKIAERKIREAQLQGAFQNLPSKGRPLPQDTDSGVPRELRMCYKILKNAGVIPEELQIRKEMLRLKDLIQVCEQEDGRREHARKLSMMQLRLELLLQKNRKSLPAPYEARVGTRLT